MNGQSAMNVLLLAAAVQFVTSSCTKDTRELSLRGMVADMRDEGLNVDVTPVGTPQLERLKAAEAFLIRDRGVTILVLRLANPKPRSNEFVPLDTDHLPDRGAVREVLEVGSVRTSELDTASDSPAFYAYLRNDETDMNRVDRILEVLRKSYLARSGRSGR